MTDIYNWRAARSGASITITGETKDRNPVKVGGIAYITGGGTAGAGAVAVTKEGERHWLRNTNALRDAEGRDQR